MTDTPIPENLVRRTPNPASVSRAVVTPLQEGRADETFVDAVCDPPETFTFGGVKVNDRTQVIGTDWRPLKGLYACGEMIGGLFYDNYPAGAGLVSGATFGRIAGRNAAAEVG